MAWIKISHTSARLSSQRICQPCITYNHDIRRGLSESSVNHYDVLGLKPTATPSQIKSAYYQLSKKYHPDVAMNINNAKDKFAELSAAYEVLGNPDKRSLYDLSLHHGMARPAMRTRTAGSDIDIEYREFMRRRGSFHPRTGGHHGYASPETSGRTRVDYDEFFRQSYARTMRNSWEARRNFQQRARHNQTNDMFSVWLYLALLAGLFLGGSYSG